MLSISVYIFIRNYIYHITPFSYSCFFSILFNIISFSQECVLWWDYFSTREVKHILSTPRQKNRFTRTSLKMLCLSLHIFFFVNVISASHCFPSLIFLSLCVWVYVCVRAYVCACICVSACCRDAADKGSYLFRLGPCGA